MLIKTDGLNKPINKLIDAADMDKISYQLVSTGLQQTYSLLENTRMPYSSHLQNMWTRHWEYATLTIESEVEANMRILDAGGTGTIFSYFLTLMKCEVYTVDIDEKKVTDAIALSRKLNLNINHLCQSITNLSFPDNYFDRVFSVCVIEHIEIYEEQIKAMQELSRVLHPGGILAMTYDYLAKDRKPPNITGGCFFDPQEVKERLIIPSGLKVIGNSELYTQSKKFAGRAPHDEWGSIGSLFLYKPKL